MIRNQDLDRSAKKQVITNVIDLSATTFQSKGLVDTDNDIKVTAISFVYSIATNTGTVGEYIQVGTAATPTLYLSVYPTASQAVGTVQDKTVASSTLLPAGTALIIRKSSATGQTNTGEVTVNVYFETVDTLVSRS